MAPPCIGTDAMSFDVNFGPCAIESIPNVFTPNSDGENDTFEIEGNAISSLGPTISVYNRWGELIHFEQDYENTWSPDQDEVSDGAYYLTLDINSYSLPIEDIDHKGVITARWERGSDTWGPWRFCGPDSEAVVKATATASRSSPH